MPGGVAGAQLTAAPYADHMPDGATRLLPIIWNPIEFVKSPRRLTRLSLRLSRLPA